MEEQQNIKDEKEHLLTFKLPEYFKQYISHEEAQQLIQQIQVLFPSIDQIEISLVQRYCFDSKVKNENDGVLSILFKVFSSSEQVQRSLRVLFIEGQNIDLKILEVFKRKFNVFNYLRKDFVLEVNHVEIVDNIYFIIEQESADITLSQYQYILQEYNFYIDSIVKQQQQYLLNHNILSKKFNSQIHYVKILNDNQIEVKIDPFDLYLEKYNLSTSKFQKLSRSIEVWIRQSKATDQQLRLSEYANMVAMHSQIQNDELVGYLREFYPEILSVHDEDLFKNISQLPKYINFSIVMYDEEFIILSGQQAEQQKHIIKAERFKSIQEAQSQYEKYEKFSFDSHFCVKQLLLCVIVITENENVYIVTEEEELKVAHNYKNVICYQSSINQEDPLQYISQYSHNITKEEEENNFLLLQENILKLHNFKRKRKDKLIEFIQFKQSTQILSRDLQLEMSFYLIQVVSDILATVEDVVSEGYSFNSILDSGLIIGTAAINKTNHVQTVQLENTLFLSTKQDSSFSAINREFNINQLTVALSAFMSGLMYFQKKKFISNEIIQFLLDLKDVTLTEEEEQQVTPIMQDYPAIYLFLYQTRKLTEFIKGSAQYKTELVKWVIDDRNDDIFQKIKLMQSVQSEKEKELLKLICKTFLSVELPYQQLQYLLQIIEFPQKILILKINDSPDQPQNSRTIINQHESKLDMHLFHTVFQNIVQLDLRLDFSHFVSFPYLCLTQMSFLKIFILGLKEIPYKLIDLQKNDLLHAWTDIFQLFQQKKDFINLSIGYASITTSIWNLFEGNSSINTDTLLADLIYEFLFLELSNDIQNFESTFSIAQSSIVESLESPQKKDGQPLEQKHNNQMIPFDDIIKKAIQFFLSSLKSPINEENNQLANLNEYFSQFQFNQYIDTTFNLIDETYYNAIRIETEHSFKSYQSLMTNVNAFFNLNKLKNVNQKEKIQSEIQYLYLNRQMHFICTSELLKEKKRKDYYMLIQLKDDHYSDQISLKWFIEDGRTFRQQILYQSYELCHSAQQSLLFQVDIESWLIKSKYIKQMQQIIGGQRRIGCCHDFNNSYQLEIYKQQQQISIMEFEFSFCPLVQNLFMANRNYYQIENFIFELHLQISHTDNSNNQSSQILAKLINNSKNINTLKINLRNTTIQSHLRSVKTYFQRKTKKLVILLS